MKLVDQSEICPTPAAAAAEPPLPLTFFDVIWLSNPSSVERCFFYSLPPPSSSTPHFITHHLPSLKSSLSQTLHHFYPLAGRLRPSPASDLNLEYRYSLGDSIPLSVFETDDEDFADLTAAHPREHSRLQRLIPQLAPDSDDGSKSLLAVQITLFPGSGVCVGVNVHHIACDGFSYAHFVKSWAAACRSDPSVPLPSHDRAPLARYRTHMLDLMEKSQAYRKLVAEKEKKEKEKKEGPSVAADAVSADFFAATFTIGSGHIEKLKQAVRAKAAERAPFHCSTFVATCAYLWVCAAKLRRYAADEKVMLPLLADWRQRLRPPAPAMYFGNCVFFNPLWVTGGEMLKEDGIVVAAEVIGRAIEALGEGLEKGLERLKGGGPVGKPALTVAGSPRLRLYEADFGWGRPVKVEIVSVKNEGVALAETRDDAGGVEIGVVMPKGELEEFASVFNQGLQLLL